MKKGKRIISVLLCLVMITIIMTGCNGAQTANVTNTDETDEATTGPVETKTSKELVYEQMAIDPLGLTGVPEAFLESRADVIKALPEEQKGGLVIGYTTPIMGPPFLRQMIEE